MDHWAQETERTNYQYSKSFLDFNFGKCRAIKEEAVVGIRVKTNVNMGSLAFPLMVIGCTNTTSPECVIH